MKNFAQTALKEKLALQHLGANIKDARLNQGLSIERFAEMTGIAASTIQQIETGEVDTEILTARMMARLLNVGLRSLLDFDEG